MMKSGDLLCPVACMLLPLLSHRRCFPQFLWTFVKEKCIFKGTQIWVSFLFLHLTTDTFTCKHDIAQDTMVTNYDARNEQQLV